MRKSKIDKVKLTWESTFPLKREDYFSYDYHISIDVWKTNS